MLEDHNNVINLLLTLTNEDVFRVVGGGRDCAASGFLPGIKKTRHDGRVCEGMVGGTIPGPSSAPAEAAECLVEVGCDAPRLVLRATQQLHPVSGTDRSTNSGL